MDALLEKLKLPVGNFNMLILNAAYKVLYDDVEL